MFSRSRCQLLSPSLSLFLNNNFQCSHCCCYCLVSCKIQSAVQWQKSHDLGDRLFVPIAKLFLWFAIEIETTNFLVNWGKKRIPFDKLVFFTNWRTFPECNYLNNRPRNFVIRNIWRKTQIKWIRECFFDGFSLKGNLHGEYQRFRECPWDLDSDTLFFVWINSICWWTLWKYLQFRTRKGLSFITFTSLHL